MFVTSVNSVLRAQEETQRVEEVMKKIVGYNPIELTGEYKEVSVVDLHPLNLAYS